MAVGGLFRIFHGAANRTAVKEIDAELDLDQYPCLCCVMMAVMNESRTLYDVIGGESVLRAMVDRFYDLMELEPEFAGIRALHPPSTDGSRDKLFWFLSGWMGGPGLYQEQFGHPRLRARHLPFPVGTSERDQWLRAMAWAMEDVGIEEDLRLRLMQSFYQTADWMRNKAD
jgi:hemoglobin